MNFNEYISFTNMTTLHILVTFRLTVTSDYSNLTQLVITIDLVQLL